MYDGYGVPRIWVDDTFYYIRHYSSVCPNQYGIILGEMRQLVVYS